MTKFKIAYIDEDNADIRRFMRYAHKHFDVIAFNPLKDMEETKSQIFEHHVNALIADFELSEQNLQVHYSGAELVRLVLEEREHFPVFILTSYEEDAISNGDDVNIVYEKNILNAGEKFLGKIKSQIEKYLHRLEEAESRIIALIEKSQTEELDAFEEEEIVKLDSMIEKALDKKSKIPENIRRIKESADLTELLKSVDELSKKIESKK